jgi:hypothetical protein
LNLRAFVDMKNWINFFGCGSHPKSWNLGKIGNLPTSSPTYIKEEKFLARYLFRDTSQNGASKAKEGKDARLIS